jgi:hypothetical protein
VDGRLRVLDNETIFERFVQFLLDSPARYHWFGRRFVVMPDHIHVIAHMGHNAILLGQWIKALKAVLGGLKPRNECRAGSPGWSPGLHGATPNSSSRHAAHKITSAGAGRASSHDGIIHEFARLKRAWRWQHGFHDHRFRTPESESRKWEYVCLNPVRAGLVKRPEEWPYGGEILYAESGVPRLLRGTPPLLETGLLIEEVPFGV